MKSKAPPKKCPRILTIFAFGGMLSLLACSGSPGGMNAAPLQEVRVQAAPSLETGVVGPHVDPVETIEAYEAKNKIRAIVQEQGLCHYSDSGDFAGLSNAKVTGFFELKDTQGNWVKCETCQDRATRWVSNDPSPTSYHKFIDAITDARGYFSVTLQKIHPSVYEVYLYKKSKEDITIHPLWEQSCGITPCPDINTADWLRPSLEITSLPGIPREPECPDQTKILLDL